MSTLGPTELKGLVTRWGIPAAEIEAHYAKGERRCKHCATWHVPPPAKRPSIYCRDCSRNMGAKKRAKAEKHQPRNPSKGLSKLRLAVLDEKPYERTPKPISARQQRENELAAMFGRSPRRFDF
jgi:hypothetical protein